MPLKVYYRVLDTTFNLQNGASGMAYDDEVYGYRRCGELHDGAVTIVDSAIYRIFSCREYSFELECRYESAAYDTGNTSQTMPYRRVKKIIMSSLGKPIDAEVINGRMHVVLRFECEIFIDNEVRIRDQNQQRCSLNTNLCSSSSFLQTDFQILSVLWRVLHKSSERRKMVGRAGDMIPGAYAPAIFLRPYGA